MAKLLIISKVYLNNILKQIRLFPCTPNPSSAHFSQRDDIFHEAFKSVFEKYFLLNHVQLPAYWVYPSSNRAWDNRIVGWGKKEGGRGVGGIGGWEWGEKGA